MTRKSVFLDTNFLVATQLESHTFFERAFTLLKSFIKNDATLYINPLVMDEFWYVFIKLNRGMGRSTDLVFYRQLEKATRNVLGFKNLVIFNPIFDKKDLSSVTTIMHNYELRPRDALIIKLAKMSGTMYVASFDTDFDRVKGITRIY